MNQTLLYVAAALTAVWGIAHLFATRGVVAGFVLVPMTMQEQIASYGPGDYADAVVLRKRLLTG